jgi:LysM repeat protein
MNKRSKAPARVLAVLALIAGFALVIAIFAGVIKSGNSDSSGKQSSSGKLSKQHPPKHVPKVYVIKNGDTLTAIAHSTGVPVAQIERLNPQTDPLSLISGEKLKLR